MATASARERRRQKILDNASSRLDSLRGFKKPKEEEVDSQTRQATQCQATPKVQARNMSFNHVSVSTTIHSLPITLLRILVSMMTVIFSDSVIPQQSMIVASLLTNSAVLLLATVLALAQPTHPASTEPSLLDTIPNLLKQVSPRASVVSSLILTVSSVAGVLVKDLFLTVLFIGLKCVLFNM